MNVWHLKNSVGILNCGPLEAFAECDPDGAAFVPTKWKGQTLSEIKVLGAVGDSELQLAELYVRGDDLVADCKHAGSGRIAPQIYWRAALMDPGTAVQIELVLSVKTELLDSRPTWWVRSFVADSKLFHTSSLASARFEDISEVCRTFECGLSTEQLFVYRQAKIGLSYAEMVHPSDFVSAAVDGAQPLAVRLKLFPERLEKGVIRRGRVCGWFIPAGDDLETAVRLAQQFVAEPLPLTA